MYDREYFNQSTVDATKFATIMQDTPHRDTTPKYAMIPTKRALAVLADKGWVTSDVTEVKSKGELAGYQKHMVTLRHPDYFRQAEIGGRIPQIFMTNSHNGWSAFKFYMSIFEVICKNGLVVSSGRTSDLTVRHVGYADKLVEEALNQLVAEIPRTMMAAQNYSHIWLTNREREAFASGAIAMRWDGDKYDVDPQAMLAPPRRGQDDTSLWTTFNVVQERLTQGGVEVKNVTNGSKAYGKTRKARAVRAIDDSLTLNRGLWRMMEELGKIKTGAS